MARMRLSGLISDIRGTLGGSSISVWKGIPYLRNKALVVNNPQSEPQMKMRTRFSLLVNMWRMTLLPPQQGLWDEYAQSKGAAANKQSKSGSLGLIPGESTLQSGMNAFVGVNQRLFRAGDFGSLWAIRLLPPRPHDVSGVQYTSLITTPTGYQITGVAPAFADPEFKTRVVVFQKIVASGCHVHVIKLGAECDPSPAIPTLEDLDIDRVRVGHIWRQQFGVDEVDICPPFEGYFMLTQFVVMREDGKMGVPSPVFKTRMTCAV